MADHFDITWKDSGLYPKVKPNPAFPNGIELDMSSGSVSCRVELPYPAKRIGAYRVVCRRCGMAVACTTAGRPDDPSAVIMPCLPVGNA